MVEMQKQIEDLLRYVREEDGPAPRERRDDRAPREALVRAASGQLRPLDLF
jgi:hypothetical protein